MGILIKGMGMPKTEDNAFLVIVMPDHATLLATEGISKGEYHECIEVPEGHTIKIETVTDTTLIVGKRTNADRIRSMTDEELGIFLCSLIDPDDCRHCLEWEYCNTGYNGMIQWVKEEASE